MWRDSKTVFIIPNDKTYQLGDNNKNVKTMKVGLSALGFKVDDQSNEFNHSLKNAITSFQKENNLQETGTFNKKTNEKFTEQLVKKANKNDTVLNKLLKKIQ